MVESSDAVTDDGLRRRYDSPQRRQQAADTRARIVAAGVALMHGHPVWDWDALTVRAAAAQARVSVRTVYRHFASERHLRDAVMEALEEESGLHVDEIEIHDLQSFTRQVLGYVSSFPLGSRTPVDATLQVAGQRKRDALLGAVARANPDWTEQQHLTAAAVIDVLWSVGSHERFVDEWGLDPAAAVEAAAWAIGLVEGVVRNGPPPVVGDRSVGEARTQLTPG